MEAKPWAQHFGDIVKNPGEFLNGHWVWLLAIILTLFLLSRINNYMEVNGVNKAIYLTRGIVGTIIAFVMAPIAFILLLNMYAWFNGLPLINLIFLWDWFKLTATTFYWLLKCIGLPKGDVMYDTNSVVRLLWVLLPLAFIWIRTATSNFWRLFLIPLILAILYLTAYKEAKPTFLNDFIPVQWQNLKIGDQSGPSLNDQIKAIERKTGDSTSVAEPKAPTAFDKKKDKFAEDANQFYKKNSAYFSLGVFIFLAFALALGYLTKFKILSLFMITACVFGFYLMMKSSPSAAKLNRVDTPTYSYYELIDKFEAEYKNNKESLAAYKYSIEIQEKLATGKYKLPKRFCTNYKLYFYDYCLTPQPAVNRK